MAPKNNLLGDLFSASPNLFSQLLFGILLASVLSLAGASSALSIFVGVLGGFALGWFTTTTTNSHQPPVVASTEGIDAGLKYCLFFIIGFIFFGYSAPMSLLLGAMGGIGGGWIIAWWKSKEEPRTQIPSEILEDTTAQQPEQTTSKYKRRPTRRYRRSTSSFNFRFWEK